MATCKECIHYDACKGTLDVVGLDIAAECPNQELLCGNFMGRNLSKNPMTNADRIRAMSDEELAELLHSIIHEGDVTMIEKLKKQGIEASLVEAPVLSVKAHLEWLKQPAEEVAPNG